MPRMKPTSPAALTPGAGAAPAPPAVPAPRRPQLRPGDAMQRAALAVSTLEGEGVFRGLVESLAQILGTDLAFIALPEPGDPPQMRMLAFHLDGDMVEDFAYPLHGTPCETVIGQCYRVYPERLGALFPLDADFARLGLDAYAGYPLNDARGAPLGIISVVSRGPLPAPEFVESMLKIFAARAVTEIERARADRALRDREAQYRAIFDGSADALVLWSRDIRIVDVNAAFTQMYGYARDEVIGTTFGDRIARDGVERRVAMIERALAGQEGQLEEDTVRKDGGRIAVELRYLPIVHRGEPHVLAVARDITERRRAESERAQLEAQLRQSQKMEAIGQLTGGIAHDFNNILTSILGYAVLASERAGAAGDAVQVRHLDEVQRAARRARDVIAQMLTFSRGGRGEPRPLALAGHVNDALSLLRSMLPSTIGLAAELPEALPLVLADPVQIEQVLLNLCINARDAIEGAGSITVSVREAGGPGPVCASCRRPVSGRRVELAVSDSGTGIAPEVCERMFEPFYTTKEVGKGSGMGLSTVHGIVHEHGGHIAVETDEGAGSIFRVLLPALDGGAAEPSGPAQRAAPAPGKRLAGRVLVIDDEPAIARFLDALLAQWGLTVTVATGAAAAERWFGAHGEDVDLVVTDQTMPERTGLQLARAFTAERPGLPVILITGYAEDIAAEALALHGIAGLVQKPIEPDRLYAAIKPYLGAG